jgi:predicted MFS family arabinose efflux permease
VFFSLLMIAQQVGYVLLPNFLEETRGFSQSMIGLLFSVGFVGTFMFNILLVHVRPRTGFLALLLTPWLAMVLLLLLIGQIWAWLAFFFLGGVTAMWIVKAACTGRVVREEMQGLAFGLVESLGFVAISVASGLAGLLYAASEAHTLPLVTSMVSVPLVFLTWLFYVVRATGEPPKD